MTQLEKQLLLADLCTRLPHKVHCRVFKLNGDIKENDDILYGVIGDNVMTLKSNEDECLMYYQIKPYLRPMSSMTEEEKKEYQLLQTMCGSYHYEFGDIVDDIELFDNFISIDWLNKNKFDYRGLIPMGLALEATESMYKNAA